MELKNTLSKILKEGTDLLTSGTTGDPKTIFQSPEKLYHANLTALQSQDITKESNIYTVCKMSHAGGLLAQTLPAFSIGANITVETFNPYRFNKEITKYTHTHLTPTHGRILALTKGFKHLDLTGIHVTCGSDPVHWDMIESFVSKGATFTANWGMSEVGPCAINTTFTSLEQVKDYKSRSIDGATLLGDKTYCSVDIRDNELYVKGDISVHGDKWFATGDMVTVNRNGEFYYLGRK
jgi:acyl-CoA synthetase (AMP-forming)/AMP-acid ligase II